MSNRYERRHAGRAVGPREEVDVGEFAKDKRSRTERDAARILYSPYYQRLADVTQIISPQSTDYVVHSRQAHAEKTAQIAQSIAGQLLAGPDGTELSILVGGLDPAAALAGGRAHDLGHPPFGHVGEEELDRIGRDVWGLADFHGNAQSVRVVTKLAAQPRVDLGMNFTRASLNATIKYPWLWSGDDAIRSRYYSIYQSEQADFDFARKAALSDDPGPTAEAKIVDFADDISYALHDIEDFWKVGVLSLRMLAERPQEAVTPGTVDRLELKYGETFHRRAWDAALRYVEARMRSDEMEPLRSAWTEDREQEVAIRQFTSHFLTRWLNQISICRTSPHQVEMASEAWHEINVLKQFTWDRVIARPALGTIQTGQRRVLRETAEAMHEGLTKRPNSSPTRLRELYKLAQTERRPGRVESPEMRSEAAARATLDYLASLTERQLVMIHGAVTGRDPLAMMPGFIQ